MANTNRTPVTKPGFTEITTDDMKSFIKQQRGIFADTGIMQTTYFVSSPGGGKTFQARVAFKEIAAEMGLDFYEGPDPDDSQFGYVESQFANNSEEVLSGLPWVDKESNTQRRAMVESFPQRGTSGWVMDEPFQAPFAQRFAAQIVHRRQIDTYYFLPKDCFVVMCGNDHTHKSGVAKLHKHMLNRLCIINVRPTVAGALRNFQLDATPEVSVYLRWFQSRLDTFDPKNDGPFGSARSWDYVNTLVSRNILPTEGNNFALYQGFVGHENALDFRVCFDAVKNMPNIEAWLADPIGQAVSISSTANNNPNVMCAFSFVMLRRLQETRDIADVGRAITVLEQAHLEMATQFIAVAKDIDSKMKDNVSILDSPAYAQFMARHPRITFY